MNDAADEAGVVAFGSSDTRLHGECCVGFVVKSTLFATQENFFFQMVIFDKLQ